MNCMEKINPIIMDPEIRKQLKQILRFIDDDYSIFQHIKENPHGQFGLLRSLTRKELKEYISLLKNKQD